MKKIDIINLGCSKNLVDAERLYTHLKCNNVRVSLNPEELSGEVAIINTCGFIGDAKEESIDTILEIVAHKKRHPDIRIMVMGCLSQRYAEELRRDIPEVDHFYGVNDLQQLVEELGYAYQQDKTLLRIPSTPAHYAYLKIAEGCDRSCAFCAIPMIRGKQKSIPIASLVEEAVNLSQRGVKELILISQELTRYGIDIYQKPQLVQLIDELSKIEGIQWIRLHYTYPNLFGDELIESIAEQKKVCHYLDMPFQHFNDRVLKMMRRGHSKSDALRLIEKIRKTMPDLALRTTILTGHPGEDELAFQELMAALEDIQFDRLGVFTYSHEEGTHAYTHYKDAISEAAKQERAAAIMRLQQDISYKKNTEKIGQVFQVLIDKHEQNYAVGRTQYDSPDIDNEVLIARNELPLDIGSFYSVKITDASEFDLMGELL